MVWSMDIEKSWLKVLQSDGNERDASWHLEREITSCPLATLPAVFGALSDGLLIAPNIYFRNLHSARFPAVLQSVDHNG